MNYPDIVITPWSKTNPLYRERVLIMAFRQCEQTWKLGLLKAFMMCGHVERVHLGLTIAFERVGLRLILDFVQPIYPDEADDLLMALAVSLPAQDYAEGRA